MGMGGGCPVNGGMKINEGIAARDSRGEDGQIDQAFQFTYVRKPPVAGGGVVGEIALAAVQGIRRMQRGIP